MPDQLQRLPICPFDATAGERVCGVPRRLRRLQLPIARGRSNEEIATELHLARHTVEGYVSELMSLCGCPNRARLIIRIQECLAWHKNKEPTR